MKTNIKKEGYFKSQITYEKIYDAYIKARKGKRYRDDVIKFSLREEDYIESICYSLKNGIYKFGKYKEFYVYEPKKRRILAASFKDRIVHTWYVKNFIEKIYVPDFIETSYACISKRGMHKCAMRVKKDMYKISKIWKGAYIIKMDVRKYFQNIDKNILYEILEEKIKDKDFLDFTKELLKSTKIYDENEEKGLPIGNYTSQMYGNIYLDRVDKYATRVLKCKYYYRYMDDTCIIIENKEKAKEILLKLNEFYNKVLMLELNEKTQIFKIKQGVNFCGYKIKIGKMYLRNKGKKRIIKKLKKIREMAENEKIDIEEIKRKLTGHIGYMKIADVKELVDKYFYINE